MGEAYVSSLFGLLLLGAYGTFFYRAAVFEKAPPLAWAGSSVALYLVTWMYWGWGFFGNLLAQAALLVGLGIARGLRKELARRRADPDEITSKSRPKTKNNQVRRSSRKAPRREDLRE